MTQAVIFRVAGASYALARTHVGQLLPAVRVTRVPQASGAFDGVVYVRSRLVPVLHVRKRLGLAPAAAGEAAVILVSWEGDLVGLRVDAIEGEADWAPGSVELVDLSRWLGHGAPWGQPVPTHEV